jgi:hypothetical protein
MNQITHLAQAPKTYNLESDSSGNWDIAIDNNLSAGAHIVSVEDEYGNIDQAIMYVIKDKSETQTATTEPIFIDRISTTVPNYLLWPLLLLTAAILFLSLFLILFARKASKREKNLVNLAGGSTAPGSMPKAHHYLRYALLICALAWVATMVAGIFLNRKTNFLSGLFDNKPKITVIDELKGQILHPLDKTGVDGIDLAYGNTSIRTSGSGHYIFNNIGASEGIKATHNELLRPLVFLPPAKQRNEEMNILFDMALMNNIIKVIDAEARGRYGDIYWNYLSPKVQSKISESGYVSAYQGGKVKPENVNDQELIIKSTVVTDKFNLNKYGLVFDKAVVITVVINGHELIYPWEYENGSWYLLN